jgi:hypothetical protein
MLEINGRWFYKKSGVKTIDLMPAFFEIKGVTPKDCGLRIFAPPAEGINDPSQGEGWELNYRTEIKNPPEMRVRYEPTMRSV